MEKGKKHITLLQFCTYIKYYRLKCNVYFLGDTHLILLGHVLTAYGRHQVYMMLAKIVLLYALLFVMSVLHANFCLLCCTLTIDNFLWLSYHTVDTDRTL
jgi:hypothetical protein